MVNISTWISDGATQLYFDTNALASIDIAVSGSVARRYVFTTLHSAVPLLLQHVDLWSDTSGTMQQRLLTVTYTNPLQDTDTAVGGGTRVTGEYVLLEIVANAFGGATSFSYQFEAVSNFPDYDGGPNVEFNGRTGW